MKHDGSTKVPDITSFDSVMRGDNDCRAVEVQTGDGVLASRIRLFARFIIRKALNLSSGQKLHLLRVPYDAQSFLQILTKEVDDVGALVSSILWESDVYRTHPTENSTLTNRMRVYADAASLGDAFILFDCTCGGLFDGMEESSVLQLVIDEDTAFSPLWEQLSRNLTKWTMFDVPTVLWARRRFPDMTPEEGVLALWNDLLTRCRIELSDGDFHLWGKHIERQFHRVELLNQADFSYLMLSGPQTGLKVGLADGHIWLGPGFFTVEGEPFIPNIPMEELFTAPHRARVSGYVRSVRTVVVNGLEMDGLNFIFKDGRIVEAYAKKGESLLQRLLGTDEGMVRLGEVALVPREDHTSSDVPTSFYATLLDENAGSHLALGRAYRTSVTGNYDDRKFLAAGGNLSDLHIDFTIGGEGFDVDGVTKDSKRIAVLRNNRWVMK